MGIVCDRWKRQRRQRIRRRMMILMLTGMLGASAMSPGLKEKLSQAFARGWTAVQVFAGAQQVQITLPERGIYALQLGVFDSGERASLEARRLEEKGIPCMIWQREKMRIVSSVASRREALYTDGAKGEDAYVIRDSLSEVTLLVSADSQRLDAVKSLLTLPDEILTCLLEGTAPVSELVGKAGRMARDADDMHPDNALYTQLAQSLMNWCTLIERTEATQEVLRAYAAVTIYALCRELRTALLDQASAPSTASAQRTPSTAAEVMPPA